MKKPHNPLAPCMDAEAIPSAKVIEGQHIQSSHEIRGTYFASLAGGRGFADDQFASLVGGGPDEAWVRDLSSPPALIIEYPIKLRRCIGYFGTTDYSRSDTRKHMQQQASQAGETDELYTYDPILPVEVWSAAIHPQEEVRHIMGDEVVFFRITGATGEAKDAKVPYGLSSIVEHPAAVAWALLLARLQGVRKTIVAYIEPLTDPDATEAQQNARAMSRKDQVYMKELAPELYFSCGTIGEAEKRAVDAYYGRAASGAGQDAEVEGVRPIRHVVVSGTSAEKVKTMGTKAIILDNLQRAKVPCFDTDMEGWTVEDDYETELAMKHSALVNVVLITDTTSEASLKDAELAVLRVIGRLAQEGQPSYAILHIPHGEKNTAYENARCTFFRDLELKFSVCPALKHYIRVVDDPENTIPAYSQAIMGVHANPSFRQGGEMEISQ